ncbi:collagen alpha-1(V) chain-like [Hippoglossus hippoglossus]|uniref:collagen alpha-1(V) chain-like n=1 Tax=Hippoglossus hippoglossus TaxID=8267 RepID=UPI00148C18D0|nr:collagen alpha-1(V) chain-like [Hippoglossus hippoglossus]
MQGADVLLLLLLSCGTIQQMIFVVGDPAAAEQHCQHYNNTCSTLTDTQQATAVDEVTSHPGIRESSRPDTSPQDTTVKAGLPELTGRLNPESSTSPLKTHTAQTGAETQTTGSTTGEKPKTVGEETVLGGANEPQTSQISGTMKETQRTEGSLTVASVHTAHTAQVHQPSGAATEGFTSNDASVVEPVEMSISSPNIQPENPTAPGVTSPSAGGATETAERSFSDGPHEFVITLISGSTTESGFDAASVDASPDGGTKEAKQDTSPAIITPPVSVVTHPSLEVLAAAEEDRSVEGEVTQDFAAPQKVPAPNLTLSAPTQQSTAALSNIPTEGGNVSAQTETTSPPLRLPGGEEGSGRDEDETDSVMEEEEEREAEVEKANHDNDTGIFEENNQSSLDSISMFSDEDFIVISETESPQQNVKAANQQPASSVRHHGAGLKPGVRGQRGLQGPPGLTGPSGPQGDKGYQGVMGRTGGTGYRGPIGPPGMPAIVVFKTSEEGWEAFKKKKIYKKLVFSWPVGVCVKEQMVLSFLKKLRGLWGLLDLLEMPDQSGHLELLGNKDQEELQGKWVVQGHRVCRGPRADPEEMGPQERTLTQALQAYLENRVMKERLDHKETEDEQETREIKESEALLGSLAT